MAVSQRPNTEPVYTAIEQWIDRCLRVDGSLFRRGHSVWNEDNLATLLPLGTIEGADFESKLKENLAGSSDEVIQLAAEVLYVHLLMSNDMQEPTKRALVVGVLAIADPPVTLPADLDAALATGLANTGIAYKTHRRSQYRDAPRVRPAMEAADTRGAPDPALGSMGLPGLRDGHSPTDRLRPSQRPPALRAPRYLRADRLQRPQEGDREGLRRPGDRPERPRPVISWRSARAWSPSTASRSTSTRTRSSPSGSHPLKPASVRARM